MVGGICLPDFRTIAIKTMVLVEGWTYRSIGQKRPVQNWK